MVERNCNDMVMDTTDDEAERSPCADLRLDCLVALGCIPPLVMAQDLAAVQVPLAVASQFTDFAFFDKLRHFFNCCFVVPFFLFCTAFIACVWLVQVVSRAHE